MIVTDLSIPRIDGFELLARIHTHPRTERIPVIVLSGWADADASQRAIAAGAAAFLLKPCSPESLIGEVRRPVHKSRVSRNDNRSRSKSLERGTVDDGDGLNHVGVGHSCRAIV